MSPFRLLAIDIDGTLVDHRDELSPATIGAIARAGRAGVLVVLATGRRYSRTLQLVEPLGIEVPLVTASGALVKNPADHRTLFRAEFDGDLLSRTVRRIEDCGFDALLLSDTFEQGFDFYQARPDARRPEMAEYLRLNPDCGRLWPAMQREAPPEVFALFTMGTLAEMLDVERRLHEALPGGLSTHVLRSPRYTGYLCEVAPAGVTKWSGIRHLAEDRGIADAEICAVGDDVNDIPMIRAAGLGVAMGNAQEAVKQVADRIAPRQNEDGLVQVVEWMLGARGA